MLQMVKNPPANAGNACLIPGLGRSPGEGNSNQIQYFCLENPTDRGVWQATVHRVAKSRIGLSPHIHGNTGDIYLLHDPQNNHPMR